MAKPSNSPARYILRREDPANGHLSAWQWLVKRNPALGHSDGTPSGNKIAEATGMDKSTLSLLINNRQQPGVQAMAALTALAMKTGVSRRTAEHHLYELLTEAAAEEVAA